MPWSPSQSQHASLSSKKFLCIAGLSYFSFSCSFPCFFCLIKTFWILQHLAPAIPWPNVIPCLPVSRILHLPWACHVVIHGDLVVMDIPLALLLLRIHLLRLAVTLILQLLMLDLLSHLQDQVTTHPIMGTQRQTWPHPSQLQLITRLQFFPDLQEKPTHSRGNWQRFVVSSTHTTLSRFNRLMTTIPNRHFADLWWRKWTDVGTIETGSRSSSSMGSLATFVLVEAVGLTRGINPPNSPTTGVAFQIPEIPPDGNWLPHQYEAPESPASVQAGIDDTDSIIANVDITPPPVQIQQLATFLWNILNNDRDANMAILERLEDPDDLSRHPVQIFSAADLAHLASHLAESTRTLSDQARRMEAFSDEALWALGLIQQMILPCILKPFPLQGMDNSLHRLWISEKASRQRGVCVDHLHRWKTSFWLFRAFVVGSTRFSCHLRRGHRCDSGSCANEDGQKSQWYQRETSLWRTCFKFHFSCQFSVMGRG